MGTTYILPDPSAIFAEPLRVQIVAPNRGVQEYRGLDLVGQVNKLTDIAHSYSDPVFIMPAVGINVAVIDMLRDRGFPVNPNRK